MPEAVGVFDTFESLQAAFYDLRSVGFHHSDISLLGAGHAGKNSGGPLGEHRSEDDTEAPGVHFVSEEATEELEGAFAGGFFFFGPHVAISRC